VRSISNNVHSKVKYLMRWSRVVICLVQAGCSSSEAVLPTSPNAPDAVALGKTVEFVSTQAKLPPPIEVSSIRAAHPISPSEWMVCVKSSAPDQSRPYAVFMRNNEMVAFRLAVLIDECDHEAYRPLVKTP
jgi:hypothetical protein